MCSSELCSGIEYGSPLTLFTDTAGWLVVLVDLASSPLYPVPLQRSKTALAMTDTRPQVFVDLERQARNDAEKAMKVCLHTVIWT